MDFSFVIPCYKSENTISAVMKEIDDTMKERPEFEYEILCVNDGSPDNVWQMIKSLSSQNDHVKGISFSRNFGQHSALLAGYRHCTGEYIVSIDDDGQTPVNELFRLADKMEEGYDAVYGSFHDSKRALFRRFGTWMAKKMGEMLIGQPKELDISSFFIARRFVITEMVQYNNSYPYVAGLLLRATKNVVSIDVSYRDRFQGKSGYSLKKLLGLWINGFTAFSVKPLELGIYSGLSVAIAGFIGTIVIFVRKLLYRNIAAGWSSVICVMLILGGMILIMLGLIGEYIGRIYISINNAPQYVIKEMTENVYKGTGGSE